MSTVPSTASPLPPQPTGVDFPSVEWPTAAPGEHVDQTRLGALFDRCFDPNESDVMGRTDALLLVQGGAIVAERYADGSDGMTTRPSWSMAKSMCHATVGILVREGLLDITAKTGLATWAQQTDPRSEITVDDLLHMSSGLGWVEDYVDDAVSDVIEMLFGSGASDTARYASGKPRAHPVNTQCVYSSGTTNIISKVVGDVVAEHVDADIESFLRSHLFDPIGMASATPRFDDAGTWIASSYCFCTPRDFARFGLLYLRDGIWGDTQLLPPGWADHARTPAPVQPVDERYGYGAHWWIGELGAAGHDFFGAHGYEGQRIWVVPSLDLVLVRSGKTDAGLMPTVDALLEEIIDTIAGG